jgi:hypothetical protein
MNTSGSIYYCHKNNEKLSAYTSGIFKNLSTSSEVAILELVDIQTILKDYV